MLIAGVARPCVDAEAFDLLQQTGGGVPRGGGGGGGGGGAPQTHAARSRAALPRGVQVSPQQGERLILRLIFTA